MRDYIALKCLGVSRIRGECHVSICAWERDVRAMSGFIRKHIFVNSSHLAESGLNGNVDDVGEAPVIPDVTGRHEASSVIASDACTHRIRFWVASKGMPICPSKNSRSSIIVPQLLALSSVIIPICHCSISSIATRRDAEETYLVDASELLQNLHEVVRKVLTRVRALNVAERHQPRT